MNNFNHSRTTAARLFASALLLAAINSALAGVHYVDVNSANATPPYTNWSTAATNIQDAVDAAVAGDEIVVTNGTYATGGRTIDGITMNRVAVDKLLSVRSVNGPQSTTIDGGGSRRCVYMISSASLSGFTLTRGSISGVSFDPAADGGGAQGGTLNNCALISNRVERVGGGADGCTLNNCTLTGNIVGNFGGGAAGCTLNNCTLTANKSFNYGGGTYGCTLNNCTLTGNSAAFGGGAWDGMLNNCIVIFNTAQQGANYGSFDLGTLNHCCTTPDPGGVGNITNAPLFMDTNGWANLRLQPHSPCINTGNNEYATNATDLDGNQRISSSIVDIGAYEYQEPQLTITPSAANVVLTWSTNLGGYDYNGFTLQSTTNLVSLAVWTTNSPAPVVIAGQNVVTNPITGAQQFFRLRQ